MTIFLRKGSINNLAIHRLCISTHNNQRNTVTQLCSRELKMQMLKVIFHNKSRAFALVTLPRIFLMSDRSLSSLNSIFSKSRFSASLTASFLCGRKMYFVNKTFGHTIGSSHAYCRAHHWEQPCSLQGTPLGAAMLTAGHTIGSSHAHCRAHHWEQPCTLQGTPLGAAMLTAGPRRNAVLSRGRGGRQPV